MPYKATKDLIRPCRPYKAHKGSQWLLGSLTRALKALITSEDLAGPCEGLNNPYEGLRGLMKALRTIREP